MYRSYLLAMAAQSAARDGVTVGKIVHNLPHDAASLFTLGLLAVGVGLVIWAGMRTGRDGEPTERSS